MTIGNETKAGRKSRKKLSKALSKYKKMDKENSTGKLMDEKSTLRSMYKRDFQTKYKGSGITSDKDDKSDNATTKSRGPNKARKSPTKPKAPRAANTSGIKKIGPK